MESGRVELGRVKHENCYLVRPDDQVGDTVVVLGRNFEDVSQDLLLLLQGSGHLESDAVGGGGL